MDQLKTILNPRVTELIIKKFPVERKRSALWFFKQELAEVESSLLGGNQDKIQSSIKSKRLSAPESTKIWHSLQPELKWRYFYMAEFDQLRFKEERSLWLAQLLSLLLKHGVKFENVIQSLPALQRPVTRSPHIMNNLKNYENFLETESNMTLYKYVKERSDKNKAHGCKNDLIQIFPEDQRSIVSRPTRPPVNFLLFQTENWDLLREKSKQLGIKSTKKLAGIEWANLSQEERSKYEEKYNQLNDEYKKALRQYENSDCNTHQNLKQVYRERASFMKLLRTKLREFDVVLVHIRNPFNFFLQENLTATPNMNKLTETWRNMPEEEKLRYKLMSQQDRVRYYTEKAAHEELLECLMRILEKATKYKIE